MLRRQQEEEAIKNSDVLVHIADTSVKGHLPARNTQNSSLYDEVNEKQKQLAKLQRQSQQLAFDLSSLEERSNQMKSEKNEMKAILSEKERQLETEQHLLKLSENEKTRLIKDNNDLKIALAAAQERNNKLNSIYERQKQLHDTLIDKGQMDNHMFEAQLHKILDTEQMGAEVKKFHSTDNKSAKELEVHLKRLTQKIFDKQQELEKLTTGQKTNQAAIDLAKRDLRNSTKERRKLTEKWEGTFAVLQRKIGDYNAQQNQIQSLQQQNERKQQRLKQQMKETADNKSQIEALSKQIVGLEQKLAKANVERERLEDQWMTTQEELSNCEVKLSQINASKEVAQSLNDRYKTKIDTFNKAKSSTITAIEDPKERNRALKNEMKQKTKKLKSIKENSLIAQQNVDGLKSRLDNVKALVREQRQKLLLLQKKSDDTAIEDSGMNSDSESESATSSRPSSKESGISSHEHSNQSLPEIETKSSKRRKKFIAERAKEGKAQLDKEKKKLQDSVSLLTAETKRLENMNANLQAEIEKVNYQELKTEKQIALVNKSLTKHWKRIDDLSKTDPDVQDNPENAAPDENAAKIEELRAEKASLESQRNLLKTQIKAQQAQVSSLKEKFEATQVAASTTSQSNWLTRKQVKRIETDHAEWKKKVDAAEDDLTRLDNTLEVASGRNQIVRENLTAVKPYSDENIEHQKLRNEYAQTQNELDQTQKRILSLQLQLRNAVQLKTFTVADKKK